MLKTLRKCSALALMAVLAVPTAFAGADPGAKPETAAAAPTATPSSATITISAEEFQAMRDAIASQQKQIDELRQEIVKHDQEPGGGDPSDLGKLKADVADLKANQTTAALQTQDEQKRAAAIEGTLGRFRWSGDVRVRQEDFFVDCPTSSACHPRARERIRLRLGLDGRLGEDFIGGVAIASGVFSDPTSTNETLTNVFERKSVTFDRGYITYAPQKWKWLSLTGGKFAYTWIRTPMTLDSDLNPEGFSEKLSFDLSNKIFKNFTAMGMQILYNEAGNSADSYAAGGQVSTRMQLGNRVSTTLSYSVLNWINADAILNQPASVTGGAAGAFAPNGVRNATLVVGGKTVFASKFTYSDFIANTVIKTPKDKWPVNLLFEFEDNLRAANDQNKSFYIDASLGRITNPGEWQVGYSYIQQQQDSVISSFNESDQRAPTNVNQHRFYVNYKVRKNTVLQYTQWIGNTLDTSLNNAARQPGVAVGGKDPFLKRAQFDIVYSF